MYPIEKYYRLIRRLPPVLRNIVVDGVYRYLSFVLRSRNIPARIVFFVTNKCNFNCGHCFYTTRLNKTIDELSSEEIHRFIQPIGHKVSLINITGGEPFLRDDLVDIVNIIYDAGISSISLNTNGFFTESIISLVDALAKNKRLRIYFNLSYYPDLYDSDMDYRKRFNQTFSKLSAREKKRHNIFVQILFTVSSKNIQGVSRLFHNFPKEKINISLFRDYQKSLWGVPDAAKSGFVHRDQEHSCLSIQRVDEIIALLKKHNIPDSLHSRLLLRKLEYSKEIIQSKMRYIDCYAGCLEGVVYPDGEVALCELTKPIGNLREYNYNLKALWSSPVAAGRRKELSSCACLSSCNLKLAILKNKDTFRSLFMVDSQR